MAFRIDSGNSEILAIKRKHVEGTELHLLIVFAGVQRIEVRQTIEAKNNRLAIDHKLLGPVLEGRFSNPRKALRPVVTASRDQSHAIAIALHAETVAIVFDFVKPLKP